MPRYLTLTLCILLLSCCSTIDSLYDNFSDFNSDTETEYVYSGVRNPISTIPGGLIGAGACLLPFNAYLAILDPIFSAALDTILLPITIPLGVYEESRFQNATCECEIKSDSPSCLQYNETGDRYRLLNRGPEQCHAVTDWKDSCRFIKP